MQLGALSAYLLCIFHAYKWENAYKRFIICPKNFNEFFNVYISVKEGLGGSLMHVYVWEHIAFLAEPTDGC